MNALKISIFFSIFTLFVHISVRLFMVVVASMVRFFLSSSVSSFDPKYLHFDHATYLLSRSTTCCFVLSSLHRRFLLLKIPGIVDFMCSTALLSFVTIALPQSSAYCVSIFSVSCIILWLCMGGDCIHDPLILEGAHFQDVDEVHQYDRLDGCYTQNVFAR